MSYATNSRDSQALWLFMGFTVVRIKHKNTRSTLLLFYGKWLLEKIKVFLYFGKYLKNVFFYFIRFQMTLSETPTDIFVF